MSDVADRVKKIVVEHLGVDDAKVTDNASFIDDLGADSLDTVELVMAFEEEFGIEIPDDAAETIQTFGDAVAVQRVIGAVERVGFIEEIRLAHGHRIDRADHDIDAVIAAEAEDAVERQVAIGAAEGPEKVERKGQVSRAPSAFAPPGSSRFPDRRIHRGW